MNAPVEAKLPSKWALAPSEIVLLLAAVAVFVLGTLFNLAESTVTIFEPWQIDEFLLALPLIALGLGLALRRRTLAWHQQNALFRAVIDHAADVVAIVDGDGVARYVSPALVPLLGEQPATWTGRKLLPLVHAEDAGRLRWLFARLITAPGDSRVLGCRLRHHDGTWRHVEVIATNHLADPAIAGIVLNVRDVTARRVAEAEVVATHQREGYILERIADGFITLDADWSLTSINPAAERMLGQPREALLGRNAWQAFAPAVETPAYAVAQEAMREGRPTTIEFFYPPFNAWFNARLYPSADGMSISFHDVTQHRTLTEELQASEARYRALVEQVPAVIYILGAEEPATRRYFSPFLIELTGYTPEEALAQTGNWLDWVHPEDRTRVEALEVATAAGEPFRAEYRHLRKDGSYVWVLDECVPVRDATGALTAWQGILLDISPLVEAEEARARLAAIVDSAEDAIFSSDLNAIVTSWNRGAEKLYGYTAAEMVGRSMTILLPEGRIEGSLAERVAATQAGDPGESYTTVRRRRDGSMVDVTVALSPIRDHAGNVTGLSSITRDITAWKQAEEQLQIALQSAQTANAAKSQFLAMMSHELRTPLQAILGYAEFLLANPASMLSAEEREDLGFIQQGGLRMLTLINQLLDLSRLEAGRFEVELKPLDLCKTLEEVRQDVIPQASQKGVRLQIILPPDLPLVIGDPERLRQVLLNLVGNAVKFTDHGSVVVHVTSQGETVAIAVTDSGIGIPPEQLPHVFEAFRQVDSRLARRHGGAGLGLAIAHKLATLMNGQIAVESRPGEGSTFTLTIPAISPPLP
jgi:PAS domain S-box-containing protein